jgi:hypothetical protein
MKDRVGTIEEIQKNLENKHKSYAQLTQQELEEYNSMAKQIDSEYVAIKKKKNSAIEDLKKV